MDKSLKTIQTLAKIGRVLSKIAWICCIIGAAGCAVGILCLAFGSDEIMKLGNVTIHGIIADESGVSMGTMYASMTEAMILSIGELIIALFAERYFKNEIADGTPFTMTGAAQMQRLGIMTIFIPIAAVFAAEIAYSIISNSFENVAEMQTEGFSSVDLGIAFLIMSVVFRYGAALEKKE